ncbi:hypothetical protein AB0896_12900 [Streptomyces parvulus]|uniref:hypothetical protein n=1 Tax=Streptomyces parvulus TaxID=146923 RepID=UPI0034514406
MSPVREALRSQWRPILVFRGISIMLAILSYTWATFYPQYLTDTLGLPHWMGLASNAISIAVLIPFLPPAGMLSVTGRPVTVLGVSQFLIQDGRVTKEVRVYDEISLRAQIEAGREEGPQVEANIC